MECRVELNRVPRAPSLANMRKWLCLGLRLQQCIDVQRGEGGWASHAYGVMRASVLLLFTDELQGHNQVQLSNKSIVGSVLCNAYGVQVCIADQEEDTIRKVARIRPLYTQTPRPREHWSA